MFEQNQLNENYLDDINSKLKGITMINVQYINTFIFTEHQLSLNRRQCPRSFICTLFVP